MTDERQREERDADPLVEAVRQLEARTKGHQQLPAPGTEFVLYAVAGLLGSIAAAIERHEAIPENVREDAERIAYHILRYADQYLPRVETMSHPHGPPGEMLTREQVLKVLSRVGIQGGRADQMIARLQFPVGRGDLNAHMMPQGVNLEFLINEMGGSP
jgi:hypothetical protein